MNESTPDGQDEEKPKVRVDEQVVRKMLKVNPDMRKGRTTFQVKKALEGGEAVGGPNAQQDPPASTPSAETPAAQPATPTASTSAAKELRDTIDFFMRGKDKALDEALADIMARRKALDEEQKALAAQYAEQVVSFISLLDVGAVAAHGKAALAAHVELLKKVGLDVASLMQRVSKK